MRFVQFHPEIREGDAVGNEVLALSRLLKQRGVRSEIFCEAADPVLASQAHPWRDYRADDRDLLCVHYSHGSRIYDEVFAARARKILRYHNVTPAEYLQGLREGLEEASADARRALPSYADSVELALADSSFNARELEAAGFRNVEVFPYVLDETRYSATPDASTCARFGEDGWVNLLSVGRIFPQKRLEDCLFIFDYFRRKIEPKSRLLLVGGWEGAEAYLARLRRLVARLDTPNVVFAGRVSQAELMAYYRAAAALISMSEHEGFCVPLVEGMRCGVPVIAFDAGAVAETMGGAGVLIRQKAWPEIAEAIGILVSENAWREKLVADQRARVEYFSSERAGQRLDALLARL